MRTLITNAYVVSPDFELENAAVLIEDQYIAGVYSQDETLPPADNVIDAEGNMLMPGFIDVHCHGNSGYDFTDADQQGMNTMAQAKLKEGVTSWLPTTLTLPEEKLAAALETAAAYIDSDVKGCRVPGVHLEGPYINVSQIGAQNPAYVRLPDIEEVKRLNAICKVLKISYAVEVEGGAEFSRDLRAMGITPSCVHSEATHADFQSAMNCGIRNISHFCNQVSKLHHREIGLVGAGLLHDDVFIEFICDKLHICPDMIKLVFKFKRSDRIMLITDAMCAAGMPDGDYELAGLEVIVKDGCARLKSNGALAGSTLALCDGLKNVKEITCMSLTELVKTTSFNQAQSLGLEKLGKIEPGFIADIVIMGADFTPLKVMVDGEIRLEK
jgi:N-acetylglucosamine-6-phosphate deacetylase